MNIGKEIYNIIKNINNLPKNDYDSIVELLEHDEWGVALENLCAALHEENINISKSIYIKIITLGQMMNMSPDTWNDLQGIIKK